MNFFAAQERSRKNTRRLIILMTLAVIAVVTTVTTVIAAAIWFGSSAMASSGFLGWALSNVNLLAWIALATSALIGFASIYRTASLRQGGGKVARDLGGTLVSASETDPLRRRLRNVVEEMSIASGVPTPEIYILDHEPAINAFAAGFSIDDAAIAVTRGTLETLSRDELQGVIAHEFSHIFNGDMRLNIQLMGPMFGILAIGMLGRMILRGGRFNGRSRGKGNGVAVALALGVGLIATGYIGLLLARLIKAGVSRQREYLADASAVQFTRQSAGIAGALKKIAGYSQQSALQNNQAEEVSHMLFATGSSSLTNLLATHPPLKERIQALDPNFSDKLFAELHTEALDVTAIDINQEATRGFTAGSNAPSAAAELTDSYGQPDAEQQQYAHAFHQQLPAGICDALESSYLVMLLIPALILSTDAATNARQFTVLQQQLGSDRANKVQHLYAELTGLPGEPRLKILNLALPLLKEQPTGRSEYLAELLLQLATQDNDLSLFEYSLLRIYSSYVQHSQFPLEPRRWLNLETKAMRSAATDLLSIYADQTNNNSAALREGLSGIDAWAPSQLNGHWSEHLDAAIAQLQRCPPSGRQKIILALSTIATHDKHVTPAEAELLRAVCAMLGCPLPPIMALP